MGKKAFVTGGTGFVGSHLVDELMRRGYEDIRCLVRSDPKWLKEKPVTLVKGDLADEGEGSELSAALAGVTHVYHVAAVTRARKEEVFLRSNVEGTLRLLRLAHRFAPNLRRFVVTSSLAVVGAVEEKVATETTPLNPITGYGRSKALMESRVWGAAIDDRPIQDEVPLTVIRPSAVYGPRERDILTFFQTVNRGLCPIVGGSDPDPISLVYVEDLVRGIVDAAESDTAIGETYFVGGAGTSTWEEVRDAATGALGRRVITMRISPALVRSVGSVVETVSGIFGAYPPLNREKAREIADACKACSSAKAFSDYGYSAEVSLEKGISRTIEWYRQHGWLG
ncbi:MAG: NAD-dependent epimerase/dehydratase family protein [Rhodothermia bacterium]|nr:NAD-dependent epimerase/dehydratase family protein [Rhodothermia bacterium]